MDSAALAAVEDIAVAAHAGVAGPFVARHAHEASRLVECGRQAVELLPELVGYLEVVALMADDIHEGLVARVAKIAFCRIGADRLAALAHADRPNSAAAARQPRRASGWRGKCFAALGADAQLNVAR